MDPSRSRLLACAAVPPTSPPRLILASASPRRRELLRLYGLPFTVRISRVPEIARPGERPTELACRLARAKAGAVAASLRRPAWVLGCDTVVVRGRQVLGKPSGRADAARMLGLLAGRWHTVVSGVALEPVGLPGARTLSGFRRTRVRWDRLEARHLAWLLASGEHRDKAGAYAAQGRAAVFLRDLRGTYTNVLGLPLDLTTRLLARAGYDPAT